MTRLLSPSALPLARRPGATAADGSNAMEELKREGFVFQQWICPKNAWGREREAQLDALLQEANQQGMHVAISIADPQQVEDNDAARLAELKRVVTKYRNNPALILWKGVDEPHWQKVPAANLRVYYDSIHALDRNHPVWVTQARRGTVEELKPYSKFFDVSAIDIYPVSYLPALTRASLTRTSASSAIVPGVYAKPWTARSRP